MKMKATRFPYVIFAWIFFIVPTFVNVNDGDGAQISFIHSLWLLQALAGVYLLSVAVFEAYFHQRLQHEREMVTLRKDHPDKSA